MKAIVSGLVLVCGLGLMGCSAETAEDGNHEEVAGEGSGQGYTSASSGAWSMSGSCTPVIDAVLTSNIAPNEKSYPALGRAPNGDVFMAVESGEDVVLAQVLPTEVRTLGRVRVPHLAQVVAVDASSTKVAVGIQTSDELGAKLVLFRRNGAEIPQTASVTGKYMQGAAIDSADRVFGMTANGMNWGTDLHQLPSDPSAPNGTVITRNLSDQVLATALVRGRTNEVLATGFAWDFSTGRLAIAAQSFTPGVTAPRLNLRYPLPAEALQWSMNAIGFASSNGGAFVAFNNFTTSKTEILGLRAGPTGTVVSFRTPLGGLFGSFAVDTSDNIVARSNTGLRFLSPYGGVVAAAAFQGAIEQGDVTIGAGAAAYASGVFNGRATFGNLTKTATQRTIFVTKTSCYASSAQSSTNQT